MDYFFDDQLPEEETRADLAASPIHTRELAMHKNVLLTDKGNLKPRDKAEFEEFFTEVKKKIKNTNSLKVPKSDGLELVKELNRPSSPQKGKLRKVISSKEESERKKGNCNSRCERTITPSNFEKS